MPGCIHRNGDGGCCDMRDAAGREAGVPSSLQAGQDSSYSQSTYCRALQSLSAVSSQLSAWTTTAYTAITSTSTGRRLILPEQRESLTEIRYWTRFTIDVPRSAAIAKVCHLTPGRGRRVRFRV